MSTIEHVRRQAERLIEACEALSMAALSNDGPRQCKRPCPGRNPKPIAGEIQRTRGARH